MNKTRQWKTPKTEEPTGPVTTTVAKVTIEITRGITMGADKEMIQIREGGHGRADAEEREVVAETEAERAAVAGGADAAMGNLTLMSFTKDQAMRSKGNGQEGQAQQSEWSLSRKKMNHRVGTLWNYQIS
jgi:hypothetical protein